MGDWHGDLALPASKLAKADLGISWAKKTKKNLSCQLGGVERHTRAAVKKITICTELELLAKVVECKAVKKDAPQKHA